jgi:hypothetical protein
MYLSLAVVLLKADLPTPNILSFASVVHRHVADTWLPNVALFQHDGVVEPQTRGHSEWFPTSSGLLAESLL